MVELLKETKYQFSLLSLIEPIRSHAKTFFHEIFQKGTKSNTVKRLESRLSGNLKGQSHLLSKYCVK